MFPNVLQQEIINYLNVCEDQKILTNKYFSKAIKKIWMKNSKCECIVGEDWNGTYKQWKVNNILHRDCGPTYECSDGYKSWHQNGKMHRLDGPAQIFPNGLKQWYINDQQYTKTDFNNFLLKLKTNEKIK